jgi:trehalose synthase
VFQSAIVAVEITEVEVGTLALTRFESVLPVEAWEAMRDAIVRARVVLAERAIWCINSTSQGGGVAEMLRSLLAYSQGAGVDARWAVIHGDPDFFRVTKRIHNRLHGAVGDGGRLGPEEQEIFRRTTAANAETLRTMIGPRDLVLVHDPQPAGLVPILRALGTPVIWRCHIGTDAPNGLARSAWEFLRPHVAPADAYIFSRSAYVWDGLDDDRVTIIPPSIDAFSAKNQSLNERRVKAILAATGLAPGAPRAVPSFLREDGTPGEVRHRASFYDGGSPPPAGAPLVVQVSRWDRLKDPTGVIRGFADRVAPGSDAHLVVAGPAVEAVTDDPEGAQVLQECRGMWEGLVAATRDRVHLACLPMEDGEENGAIVNALQRRAAVIVQKSLAEGFGLTVTEAMWKSRAVVASRIGGIQDQIEDGVTGVLVDPVDPEDCGDEVLALLNEPARAEAIGAAARARVRDRYLGPRHLIQYLHLFERLLQG